MNNIENTSFRRKVIELHVSLRSGSFSGQGNTKVIRDLPIKVKVEKAGPPDKPKASVEVAGMKYEDMEQLTTLAFSPLANGNNTITVLAGSEGEELSQVFSGEITEAAADFSQAPDIWWKADVMTGYVASITPQGPTAIQGEQPAADFIEQQAKLAGMTFQNNGVTARLKNSMFSGSPIEQARTAAREVGAELIIDDNKMILSPKNGAAAKTGTTVLLNKDSGLIGYPAITSKGVDCKALYNPAFKLGEYVKIESIVPKATGLWRIVKLAHELHANCPDGGPWESQLTCYSPNVPDDDKGGATA